MFYNNTYSCMEHSVDLSAKTFVQAIAPASPRRILKKMKTILKDASIDGSGAFDLDDLDARLANFDFEENGDDGDAGEGSEDEEADDAEDTADAIRKALYLVKQVSFYCLLI